MKRAISLIVFVITAVMAYTQATSGTCGKAPWDQVNWEFNPSTRVLTLSGTGETEDYSPPMKPTPWSKLNVEKLVIESGITRIGTCAFSESKLYSVEIKGNTLTEIAFEAFDCEDGQPKYFSTITLPTSIKTIGSMAFRGNTNLKTVNGGSPTTINGNAFYGCTNLTKFENLSGVKTIDAYAFYNCQSLGSVVLPAIETVGVYAFGYCSRLTSVELGTNLTSLGSWAFSDCTGLTDLVIRSYVDCRFGSELFKGLEEDIISTIRTKINYGQEDKVMSGQSGLKNTRLDATLTDNIDTRAFGEWITVDIVEGSTITDLPDVAGGDFPLPWAEYEKIMKVLVISPNVTRIGEYNFYYEPQLAGLIIHEGCQSIGYSAFAQCPKLQLIHLMGNTLKSIETNAFAGCTALTQKNDSPNGIVCYPDTPPTLTGRSFGSLDRSLIPLSVKSASENAYRSATEWSLFHFDASIDASAVPQVTADPTAPAIRKQIINGQLIITTPDGRRFNALGQPIE